MSESKQICNDGETGVGETMVWGPWRRDAHTHIAEAGFFFSNTTPWSCRLRAPVMHLRLPLSVVGRYGSTAYGPGGRDLHHENR